MSLLHSGPVVLVAIALLSSTSAARPRRPDHPASPAAATDRLAVVSINDNRRPAGTLTGGTLTLALRARLGVWRPEGAAGPALPIEAFGEGTAPLSIPAPLIRVPEGTEILATVRNELTAAMRVHGLCERSGAACPPIEIPAGEARDVRFMAGRPGTYHYWATTTGMPLQFRAVGDTQLSGAFVVDPAGADPTRDRIFVVTDWTNLTLEQLRHVASADDPGAAFLSLNPRFTFLMNGLSWPHTERLTYQLSEHVRWRVLNLSTQAHTMHLHGFYFDVDNLGDGLRDQPFASGQHSRVVTQLMPAGGTMAMRWMPERIGNWLFHCHIRAHVSPDLRLGAARGASHDAHEAGGHAAHDAAAGMAGMILGVTVVGIEDDSLTYALSGSVPTRRMTLEMQAAPGRFGEAPAFGFVLAGEGHSAAGAVPVPGPTLILKRDEPVEITLVNRLPEATAIHWHGMELESYYDGVHGFSGTGQRITPLIEPGGTFVVRFTPPRTGTFMYHTHCTIEAAQLRAVWGDARRRAERDRGRDDGSRVSDRTRRSGSGRARRAERPARAAGGLEIGHTPSRPADQHHAERHFYGRVADQRRRRRVAAADEGRRAGAGRAAAAAAGKADNRRRRDLRLRIRGARGPPQPLARGANPGRQVADAGACDCEVTVRGARCGVRGAQHRARCGVRGASPVNCALQRECRVPSAECRVSTGC